MKHLDQAWWMEQGRTLDELLGESLRLLAENRRLREGCRDGGVSLPPTLDGGPSSPDDDAVQTLIRDLGSLASGLGMRVEALRRKNEALQAASATAKGA
ncbi:MAG: hypothetical protein ACYS8K_08390 [Planctomycetota bacterium]|jgi:hypothetical protein